LAGQVRTQFSRLKGQGASRLGQLAETGKDQVASKLDDVAQVIATLADTGRGHYGDAAAQYVERYAGTVSSAAESLRRKSVHGLITDSRAFLGNNVGVAVGTAAVLGFAAARIAKGGLHDEADENATQPTSSERTIEPAGAFA
jgi:hypothetical protein